MSSAPTKKVTAKEKKEKGGGKEEEEEDMVISKETVGNGWDILNAVLAGHSKLVTTEFHQNHSNKVISSE